MYPIISLREICKIYYFTIKVKKYAKQYSIIMFSLFILSFLSIIVHIINFTNFELKYSKLMIFILYF